MKPFCHAKNSAKKFGGEPEEYMPIHEFMDSSKATIGDMRHRAILHSAFGIFVAERVFGSVMTNSEGRKVSVRDIAEDHVIEDLGFIPSVENWLAHVKMEPWMRGDRRGSRKKFISYKNEKKNVT
jgi:Domain of unknown function (DUF6915)